ncbi:MAG: hypothetical protein LYZ66_06185 [Nitrososphaerales archaeon]|nr:hypothetical protein [Nitrososphaerales archaeon]
MRIWVPVAFIAIVVLAYSLFYIMGSLEEQGASSFGIANTVGLVVVTFGVIAAGILLRRSTGR